ncbi:MAG: hypothetical protein KZQ58_12885 [gamma proteobacterium symbiont of Bathyaustriella thionipta]|nr:hypothetical protein [gamma proteobacterium symbiont of Bathyaustriella thionipta]
MLPFPRLSERERKLLKLFKTLAADEQGSLLDFAGFLSKRQGLESQAPDTEQPAAVLAEPQLIAGPDDETVIAALKRLSGIYHMLPKERLLNKTANLMTAHIVKGQAADEIIVQLEDLFLLEYEAFKSENETHS